jgi:hypothetical protein
MADPVRIDGLKEFRKALRDAVDATPRELSAALKPVAEKVAGKARGFTRGRIAAAVKPFAAGTKAGIRSRHPGARVHEFATTFKRRNPGGGGEHTVRWSDPADPPRYAYRAADELADKIGEDLLDAIEGVVRAKGWLG